MGEIVIGGQLLEELTDPELVAWMNDRRPYRLRKSTATLWVDTLRLFGEDGPPMTVRQIFYALETRGVVPKTLAGYRRVQHHVLEMRRAGVLPYSFVSDSTRWQRKPTTYTGLRAYFEHGRRAYRRALWANQRAYVEIWLEKDALAGVFSEITGPWDVPLMVTRGYPSETFVFEAAEAIKEQGKPTYVYAFYDYDPSGQDIAASTEAKLRRFGAEIHFELVAVREWQIAALGLPTRPLKGTDTRKKDWRGGCVELDAIPAKALRKMVEETITRHIDQDALERQRQAEAAERLTLGEVLRNFVLAPNSAGAEEATKWAEQ